MFNGKIKAFIRKLSSYWILDDIDPCTRSSIMTYQEDTRIKDAIQRVQKAFAEQEQQIHIRSLKQHAFDCSIIDCIKDNCFIWEPDKIVGKIKEIKLKTKFERMNDYLKSEAKMFNRPYKTNKRLIKSLLDKSEKDKDKQIEDLKKKKLK